jgi:integrase
MLTEKEIRALKPDEKTRKYFDGGGLFIEVRTNGKRYWRYKYRFGGKGKLMALGVYPGVSLKAARRAHAEARALLEDGIDPMSVRRQDKAELAGRTFKDVAREWLAHNKKTWASSYHKDIRLRLEKNMYPHIGGTPIVKILPVDVLRAIREMEKRGVNESAHKVLSFCSQIFRYAVAAQIIDSDPTRDLQGALVPTIKGHFAAITDERDAGPLMRAIAGYHGAALTGIALKIHAYTFCRPGEIRKAEWAEIDFDKSMWVIPSKKMKMKRDHVVPLSRQAAGQFRLAETISGDGTYVFPSIRTPSRPMSDGTVNAALRRMGYTKEEMTAHGFRHMASTLLNERGYNEDVIERQLAHVDANKIRGTYNRAKYLEARTVMMQEWADYLDNLAAQN